MDSLYSHLYNNPINKENLDLLLRVFNIEEFVAFLGAGINSSIKDIPTNEDLYKKLCDKYEVSKEGKPACPESFASLYERCAEKEQFDEHVLKMVKSQDTSGSWASYDIIHAFNCYVTTNYYDPIEDIFDRISKNEKRGDKLSKYYFRLPVLLGHPMENSITYLHGHEKIGFCILRKKDYSFFYPSLYEKHLGVYALENSLYYLFTNKHVVFMGCSLENDLTKYLEFLIELVRKKKDTGCLEKSTEVKEHFWVTSDLAIAKIIEKVSEDKIYDEVCSFFERYSEIKIRPIIYKGGHIFIEKLCENLSLINNQESSFNEQPDVSKGQK